MFNIHALLPGLGHYVQAENGKPIHVQTFIFSKIRIIYSQFSQDFPDNVEEQEKMSLSISSA